MQVQKGELIGELNAKMVTTTITEITPMGIHMISNDVGQFMGKFNANHMETTTIFQNVDGTNEWETKAIETTNEGDMLVISGRGTGNITGPGKISWQGVVTYMTKSPKLEWLNTTKGWVEGWIDQAKNEGHAKIYVMK